MADLASYLAEFSLIGSITLYAHTSSVLLKTFTSTPHFFRHMIIFDSIMWFYLLAWQLPPGPNSVFKYLYWKYVVASVLSVEFFNGNATIEILVLTALLNIVLNGIITCCRGWNLERQLKLQPGIRSVWDVIVSIINNDNIMVAICGSCGLIFLVVALKLKLFFLCVLSYISFQWFTVEIGYQKLNLPNIIPIPFDICCLLLCHAFFGLPVTVYYVVGNEFHGGFMTFCISIACFFYYYR